MSTQRKAKNKKDAQLVLHLEAPKPRNPVVTALSRGAGAKAGRHDKNKGAKRQADKQVLRQEAAKWRED